MEVKELMTAIIISIIQYVHSSFGLKDCTMFAKPILQTACKNLALFKVMVHLWDFQS